MYHGPDTAFNQNSIKPFFFFLLFNFLFACAGFFEKKRGCTCTWQRVGTSWDECVLSPHMRGGGGEGGKKKKDARPAYCGMRQMEAPGHLPRWSFIPEGT
jgi:hypothetical protein